MLIKRLVENTKYMITVEPLLADTLGTAPKCPLKRGVRLKGVCRKTRQEANLGV
jgi:hypothetical protein